MTATAEKGAAPGFHLRKSELYLLHRPDFWRFGIRSQRGDWQGTTEVEIGSGGDLFRPFQF